MNFLLIAHVTGAVVSAVAVALTIGALVTRRAAWFRPLSVALAVLGAYQVVSGAVLAVANSSTLLSFCARVGVYLAVIVTAEVVLVVAMRRASAAATAPAPRA